MSSYLAIRQKVRQWFKEQIEKTPMLMLVIGVVTVTITATSLGFTIAGYLLQRHANYPELASAGPHADFRSDVRSVDLEFTNIGKKPARRGFATLFGVDENKDLTHKQKLGEATIIGAGTNVVPGWNGEARFTFRGQIPDLFLVCVSYFDDGNNFLQQTFLLNVKTAKENGGGLLDELETPSGKACS